jgi:hypothetical protein
MGKARKGLERLLKDRKLMHGKGWKGWERMAINRKGFHA